MENENTRFARALLRRIQVHKITQTGAQMAYYLVMSFFPFLIFLLNVISYTSLDTKETIQELLSVLPQQAVSLLQPILLDILSGRSAALLSFSLFLALWSGSNGMNNIIIGMNQAFRIKDKRNFLLRRIIAVLYTLLLVLLIFMAMLLQIFGDTLVSQLISRFEQLAFLSQLWFYIKMVVPIFFMILAFSLLYRFGPGFEKGSAISLGEALLGGVMTSIGWTVVSSGFAYYVNRFGNYSKIYGSLGGIIIFMLWLFISSVIIVFGAEVVALVHARKESRMQLEAAQEEGLPVAMDLDAPKERKGIMQSLTSLVKGMSGLLKDSIAKKIKGNKKE